MTKPTYSNIYGSLRGEDRFFMDVPYYCDYLFTFSQLMEFKLDTMLDIGCGHGAYEEYMSSHWGKNAPEYMGIDIDDTLIQQLSDERYKTSGLMEFKSRRKFDVILCHSVLQYIDDLDAAVQKLRSLVKKTGFVSVFQTMTKQDYARYKGKWEDPYAIKRDKLTYRKAFLKEFDIISYGILVPKGQQKSSPYGADEAFIFES